MRVNVLYSVFFLGILCTCGGCGGYTIGDKFFMTQESAFRYQKQLSEKEVAQVQRTKYFGGSILYHLPSDENLSNLPFVTMPVSGNWKTFFVQYYKNDFGYVKEAIKKSGMFDSVELKQTDAYLRYAKEYGYRYLLVNNGDGTYTIYDLILGKDKTIRGPKGIPNLIYLIEDSISKFEDEKSSVGLYTSFDQSQSKCDYKYDDNTGRGYISVNGKGIETRAWMLKKISEIASTKNILLEADEKPVPGYYRVLDERIKDGIFTIEFEVK